MISKEEAEEKLLKIFYDVKLDSVFKRNPNSTKIEFEESKDPNDLDHYFNIKDNVLQMGIRAINLEHGIPYIAVQMAGDCAKEWKDKFPHKKLSLIFILEVIISILVLIVAGILDHLSINIIGPLLIISETGGFIYFLVLYFKWKKRIIVRFKGFFKNTGIFLPEETVKRYAKFSLNDNVVRATNFSQCFIAALISLTWFSFISTHIQFN